MMEAARTSETLVNFYWTTWCCNPEDKPSSCMILLEYFVESGYVLNKILKWVREEWVA
jgi:hypothetical protein